jgi:hypothetical protein
MNKIMWKNIVERSRPHMATWRMRIAGQMPEATKNTHTHTHTHTHTGGVILTAFPLQHLLHELS